MKKKLKWAALALIGVVIIAVVGVIFFLDSIVRTAVEKGTTQSLALNTTLGNASVGLTSGDVSLGDLKIANPEGFDAPEMLSLGKVSLDTSYGKVFGTPTTVDSLVIDKPKLVLEFKGMKSNLKTVADRLASSGGDQPSKPTPADPSAKPLKMIIDTLKVSGAQVEIRSDLPGLDKPYVIDVPAIEMTQIGNADGNRNGEEAGKIVSQIISRLSLEAQKSGKLPPQLAAVLQGDLDSLIKNIGGKFAEQTAQLQAEAMKQVDALKDKAQQTVDDAKAKAQGEIGKLGEKLPGDLGGMLGGDDKKDDDKKKK
jgi:uncharacterized protein involved in outer membrane biogenesis